jgi:hypothetical protein
MQLDELYPNITGKEKKFDQMLNCGPMAYTVNIIKIEYLPLGKPMVPNIVTLLV